LLWDPKEKKPHPFKRIILARLELTTFRFSAKSSADETLELSAVDTLRLSFTTKQGGTTTRPHQSFILVEDPSTNLEIAIPVPVKYTGKAKLDLVLPLSYWVDNRNNVTFHLNWYMRKYSS
jgi:hypothetical protein